MADIAIFMSSHFNVGYPEYYMHEYRQCQAAEASAWAILAAYLQTKVATADIIALMVDMVIFIGSHLQWLPSLHMIWRYLYDHSNGYPNLTWTAACMSIDSKGWSFSGVCSSNSHIRPNSCDGRYGDIYWLTLTMVALTTGSSWEGMSISGPHCTTPIIALVVLCIYWHWSNTIGIILLFNLSIYQLAWA